MMDFTSKTVIYPTKDVFAHQILLIITKLVKSVGLFAAFDALSRIHTLTFLLILKLSAAAILLPLQKPFSTGSSLKCTSWLPVIRYSFMRVILDTLWIEGLILCGPFRFILLFENCELLVLAAAGAIVYGSSDLSKVRGTIFFVLGILSVIFFDHDVIHSDSDHPEGVHKSLLIHKVYELFTHFGLSDHKVGVLVLLMAVCLDAGLAAMSRTLVASIGGGKRLYALSSLLSLVLVVPLCLIREGYHFVYPVSAELINQAGQEQLPADGLFGIGTSTASLAVWLVIIGVSHVADFYFTNLVANRLGSPTTSHLAKWSVTLSSLILCFLWSSAKVLNAPVHSLSAGGLFAVIAILYASSLLTTSRPGHGPDGGSSGHFIGYSLAGLPMFTVGQTPTHGMALLSGAGHDPAGLWSHITSTLRHILSDPSSLRIFIFLCLNLTFTFVELLYGVWTNSLGLISDGFHMLFDSAALVGGLYASVVAHWKPTRVFSFGFHSAEVLSGFVNALFLLIISGSVLVNALARIHQPPHIETDRLMVVSVGGLLVNLVGILALGHTHSHGSSHGHGHSHGHSHGSGDSHCGHAGGKHQGTGRNHDDHASGHGDTNLRGVYLHVLADTLGSVGVIFSSFLVSTYGWNIADPICSVFIGFVIFYSSVPLLYDTVTLLTLQAPDDSQSASPQRIIQKVLSVDGVLAVNNPLVWSQTRSVTSVSLSVQIADNLPEQAMLAHLKDLLSRQCSSQLKHLTIQIEKSVLTDHFQAMQMKSTVLLHFPKVSMQPDQLPHHPHHEKLSTAVDLHQFDPGNESTRRGLSCPPQHAPETAGATDTSIKDMHTH